jgi:hypothetical protein
MVAHKANPCGFRGGNVYMTIEVRGCGSIEWVISDEDIVAY